VALVLLADGEQVIAVGERCPHLGAPMADGWIDRGRVVCPWHGSSFEPGTGRVLRGPATAPLPCYPTRVRDGVIEVRGAAPTPVQTTGAAQ
jgi:nitrite reductase/ring-hydroxylating ferredoxin subunit